MSGIDRVGKAGGVDRDQMSSGLGAREKVEARQEKRNEAVDQVAKLYEKQFLREMVRAMRGTVTPGFEKPSMAENIYKEQLDQQYVEAWGDKGGVGLSDVIYEQIMERYFGSQGKAIRNQGAIEVTDRTIEKVAQLKTSEEGAVSKQTPLRIEIGSDGSGQGATLKTPWDGKVVSTARLPGKSVVTLDHGAGLKSTMVFQGVPAAGLEAGAEIQRGRTVGVMEPQAKSFLWNIVRPEQEGTATL